MRVQLVLQVLPLKRSRARRLCMSVGYHIAMYYLVLPVQWGPLLGLARCSIKRR